MDRVRIGVIGAGVIGRRHAGLVATSAACELVGICSQGDSGRLWARDNAVPWFATPDGLVGAQAPDGLIIATPNRLHAGQALVAIRAGIPVLVEKPLADTLEAAGTVVAASRDSGVPVLVGHQRRYHPIISAARAAIDSGRLGQIIAVQATWLVRKPPCYFDTAWRREAGGGPLLLNLIHDLDMLRHLVGEVVAVEAMLSDAARGLAVEDSGAISLGFANGALGSVLMSDATAAPWSWDLSAGDASVFPQQDVTCLHIAGSRGALALPSGDIWSLGEGLGWADPMARERLSVAPVDPFEAQLQHFIAVIRREAEPRVSAADATATLKLIAAIRQAAATGTRVRL